MKQIKALLCEHPFFQGLDSSYIELMAGCGKNVHFKEGEIIFRQGSAANAFYIIRKGSVALDIDVPPRGLITIDTVKEGEVLGVSWLFPPYRLQFDARALKPVSAIELDGQCLRGKCETDPKLGYELMKRFAGIAADRLQATRIRLLDMYGEHEEV
ncbi:MAG: cyclic nucleotide-binding domain-containing protein [Deltaproteobacteria bacterium]|nr:cyclic nucleotide-binding domain-containing protein [Deltaproteobacteria bacterium]